LFIGVELYRNFYFIVIMLIKTCNSHIWIV
jgi:hypothetical protein